MWFKKTVKPMAKPVRLPITEEGVEEQVKAFLSRKSKLIKPSELDRQTPLFSSGLLDSLTFIQLVVFLESTFQVKLPRPTDTTMARLDSVGHIMEVVLKAAKMI